jgi:drug/metabolite transporter (DMT)-like permease
VHYAVLLGAQLAIGAAAIIARSALDAGLPPLALSFWRMAFSGICIAALGVLLRDAKERRPLTSNEMTRLCLAGALLAAHFATWFGSLQHVSVARSTLLVCTGPVWAGLAERLVLRRPQRPAFWIGLAVAGTGVALVVTGGGPADGTSTAGNALLGDVLAVLGAISIAGYLLLVEDAQRTLGTTRTVTWTYSAAAAALLPFALTARPSALPGNAGAWLLVASIALVPQMLGHTALNWSLRRFTASVVAAATLLEPVFAGALAWLLFQEALTAAQLGGAALLLAGVGIAVVRREKG